MKVNILRQKAPNTRPYWEAFVYDGPTEQTVAGLLDYLNYNDDIVNDKGEHTARIHWECACLQGMCGACAMVINGVPALACETFLRDLPGEELTLRPLRKFPVVRDLQVDRSSIQQNLLHGGQYVGPYTAPKQKEHDHRYAAAKCLKCGLCLEVCPNYVDGRNFYGALFANDCYLLLARQRDSKKQAAGHYREHFGRDCSKSLSCMEVCPMHIPTIASMAKLNRAK